MLGLTDQVTAVLLLPVTVAVNCCVCPCDRDAVAGLTATETLPGGRSVTTELAVLVGSSTLMIVTVTVCWVVITSGAWYRPEKSAPTPGFTDQVTPPVPPETVGI